MEPIEQPQQSRVIRIPLKKIVGTLLIFGILFLGILAFIVTDSGSLSQREVMQSLALFSPLLFIVSVVALIGGLFAESKKHLITFGLITLILAVSLFVFVRAFTNVFGVNPSSLEPSYYPVVDPDYAGRGGYGQPNVTDTREFLKVSYNATLKTRDVRETVRDVKGAIRDAEGRIDNENTSDKRGTISFVVPKSKFDAFRDEIESLTHSKLYTETISSQNLLNQKQGIEQQMQTATSSLASLEQQKRDLDARHNQTINTIQRELTSIAEQLTAVRQAMNNTQDEAQLAQLRAQESALVSRQVTLRQNRDSENASYNSRNQTLTTQIAYAKNNVNQVQKQDDQFTNNIETVNGYIHISWIGLWGLAAALSPIHPIIIVLVLAVGLAWFLSRKGYIPKIEFS
jgi:hypothetical protein